MSLSWSPSMESLSDTVITDVKFVAALTYVPPKYSVISHLTGSSEDANLWKDRLLARRTRYLCFKKDNLSNCTPRTPVLANMLLLQEGEVLPAGWKPIIEALGTGERALKKRTLCVHYLPLDAVQSGITDIIIYGRHQKVVVSFPCAGELNNLMIFTKFSQLNKQIIGTGSTSRSPPTHNSAHASIARPPIPPVPSDAASMTAFATKRRGNIHPLSGIPFLMSKKYVSEDSSTIDEFLNSFTVKTKDQIENEYDYRFTVERSLLQSC